MSRPEPESATRQAEPVSGDDPRVLAMRLLIGVIDQLREPGGCPWDREQTEASMAPSLIEEAHELVEAIETGAPEEIAEEAGDVLMNVFLICRIGMESGRFDLAQAATSISEKLVRRHPHVFGDKVVESTEEVLSNWEAIKKRERQDKDQDASALAGVPKGLPALQRAARVTGKAVMSGFRWQNVAGAFAKLTEELRELEEVLPAKVLDSQERPELTGSERERIEHELGDVLFAGAILGQYLNLDPERLCREAVRRFEQRFRAMEAETGVDLGDSSLEEKIAAWKRAKESTGP